jgi:hypothetical protein
VIRALALGCSLAAVIAAPAFADGAKVCTKFAWPVDRELLLLRASPAETASGAALPAVPVAVSLQLATGVTLPSPSEKPSDAAKFAGFVTLPAVAAGDYLVSLSGEAWIDVLQDGQRVASYAHSGDPNCPGLRKSMRFTLATRPVTIQISNGTEGHILLAVTPWYSSRK